MSLPRYESYRDSGAQWLGELPSHWRRVPFWSLFRRVKRTGHACEELLSVYRDYGVIRKADRDDNFNKPSDDLDAYQLVEVGDLAINKMKAWQGSLGVSEYRGIVSPAYFVYVNTHTESARFLHYLLRSPPLAAAFMTVSKGIRINQWDIDPDHLSQLPIPLPSEAEQRGIVAFLDCETARIDALMEEQRQLILRLKEKRQGVISQAITKGLDPSVPMKESGVEWLGEIPAHWEVSPLKWLTPDDRAIMYGIVLPGPDVGSGVPIVKGGDVRPERLRLDSLCYTTAGIELPFARARLKPNDVVYSIRGSIGDAELVPDGLGIVNITQDVARISPRDGIHHTWLLFAMKSQPVFVQLEQRSLGAAVRGINIFDLKRARIPVPPIREQRKIAAFLSESMSSIQALEREANRAIALLREHRAALISAAVTGKVDVRSASTADQPKRVRDLACAEIIRLSAARPTFGRVKFQKLTYLAEAHNGIAEIGGSYAREAAGPLDRQLMEDLEQSLSQQCVAVVEQADGPGSHVTYKFVGDAKAVSSDAAKLLGRRCAGLRDLIKKASDLDTKSTEAVATLYAVWNDELIDGRAPTDAAIVSGVLNDWHPEKPKKFTAEELARWLAWMRRNGIVPSGSGPKTHRTRLFA